MIFKTLEVENFGLYAGRQCLNLQTERGRPIVLVGGTNGAGKTTILEAFTLCIHGRRALGPRVALEHYEAHIRSRLHASPTEDVAAEAEVALLFQHVHVGRSCEYLVSRRWRRLPSGRIRETLSITGDDEDLADLSEAARQDFLDSLLPPALAGFFLFDGEQIQALADDENGEQLADAVKRLLGLDLIDQLQADLRRFAGQHATSKQGRADARRLEVAAQAVETARTRVERLADKRADLQARLDQLSGRAERIRERFAREGGALAAERASVERAARKAAAEVATTEEELRGLVAGVFPFAISQRIAASVQHRLALEQVGEENEIVARRLAAASGKLKRRLRSTTDTPVIELICELLGLTAETPAPRLHDVSAAERAVLLDQLHNVQNGVSSQAVRLAKRLRTAEGRREATERQLQRAPDDEALAPLLSELQEAERTLGTLTAEITRLDEERRAADHELKVAERELGRADTASRTEKQSAQSAELALRTIALLEEYGEIAESRRLDQVAHEATLYFNRLSRKGELLSKIVIDPDTFRVTVVRWDGAELPKQRLSAGEKQLFAIAMLWALARASKRPLPVVVDTPLARLDQEHRRRLLREYLPHVSRQVVVLSTDTEVDLAAAAEIEPATARQIFLRHDTKSASTTVEEGYFSPPGEALAHAR